MEERARLRFSPRHFAGSASVWIGVGAAIAAVALRRPSLSLVVVAGLFVGWLLLRKPVPASVSGAGVVFDTSRVARTDGSGQVVEAIEWKDLAQVEIITTDEGPWSETSIGSS